MSFVYVLHVGPLPQEDKKQCQMDLRERKRLKLSEKDFSPDARVKSRVALYVLHARVGGVPSLCHVKN